MFYKLIITDPWESYIVTNVSIRFNEKELSEILINSDKEITFKNMKTNYLLGKLNNEEDRKNLYDKNIGVYRIYIAYIEGLSQYNFNDFSYNACRGDFLSGEIIIE